jgi:hypothetical protein
MGLIGPHEVEELDGELRLVGDSVAEVVVGTIIKDGHIGLSCEQAMQALDCADDNLTLRVDTI